MSQPRRVKGYGWRKDLPDPRDRLFNLEHEIKQAHQLPAVYDLETEMPSIYDQGHLGSCTANAVSAILEHQQVAQGATPANPSRLFLYFEERRLGGYPLDQDTGAEVRDGIKVAVSEGVPDEQDWPYDVNRFAERPPDVAYQHAVAYEAVAYKRIVIGAGAPMRTAIAMHLPIAFGFPVPATFETTWDPRTEFLPLPGPSDQFIGGHAVVVVGYDFSLKRFPVSVFKVRNSWGDGWGERGHFWMHANWFDPFRQLADDLWVVSRVKQGT